MKICGSLDKSFVPLRSGVLSCKQIDGRGETVTEVVLISSNLDKKNYRDFAFKKLDRYLWNYFST